MCHIPAKSEYKYKQSILGGGSSRQQIKYNVLNSVFYLQIDILPTFT